MLCTRLGTRTVIRGHVSPRTVGGGIGVTLGVVEANVGDLARTPDDEAANGREDDTDEEEGGEDRLRCEDGLPCLETLLLERGVWLCQRRKDERGGGGEATMMFGWTCAAGS